MALLRFLLVKVLFSVLVLTTLLSCAEQYIYGSPGVLRGKISIGPLCPVETIPPQPGCIPTAETYKAYSTAVWNINKTKKIASLTPTTDGYYLIALPSGKYTIDFDSGASFHSASNLPAQINVIPNDTTVFNITIDTGIR